MDFDSAVVLARKDYAYDIRFHTGRLEAEGLQRAIMFDHRQVNAWGLRNPTRYRVTAAAPLKAWEHGQREEADTDGQTCL